MARNLRIKRGRILDQLRTGELSSILLMMQDIVQAAKHQVEKTMATEEKFVCRGDLPYYKVHKGALVPHSQQKLHSQSNPKKSEAKFECFGVSGLIIQGENVKARSQVEFVSPAIP